MTTGLLLLVGAAIAGAEGEQTNLPRAKGTGDDATRRPAWSVPLTDLAWQAQPSWLGNPASDAAHRDETSRRCDRVSRFPTSRRSKDVFSGKHQIADLAAPDQHLRLPEFDRR